MTPTAPPLGLVALCEETAREFRVLARYWYEAGDESRGDQMTARSLFWEMAAEAAQADLALLRTRP